MEDGGPALGARPLLILGVPPGGPGVGQQIEVMKWEPSNGDSIHNPT